MEVTNYYLRQTAPTYVQCVATANQLFGDPASAGDYPLAGLEAPSDGYRSGPRSPVGEGKFMGPSLGS
jgi:hypothetical protein